MTIIEFKEFLRDIGIYYERKAPGDGTTEAWFERVKKIPSEPLGWIADRIFDSNETYPKNIPNIMWSYYREWILANPNKIATKNYFKCPECDGEGIIGLTKKANGYQYNYVARCNRCKQSDLHGIPYLSRSEAVAQGYTVIEQPKPSQIPTHSKDEIQAIIYRMAHNSKMERVCTESNISTPN